MPAYGVSQSDVRHANVSATADGDNTIIASPGAGLKIIVLGFSFSVNAAAAMSMKSLTSGTVHFSWDGTSGSGMPGFVGNWDCPAFEVDAANALAITNAAGQDTKGCITYYVVGVE